MAYQIPVKYFNSFWLKKVVGDQRKEDDIPTTVTTDVKGGNTANVARSLDYVLPTWPGLPWGSEISGPLPQDPTVTISYPDFPWGGGLVNESDNFEMGEKRQWFVEEARIKGGYNNTTVDFGVKAYAVEESNEQLHRFNSLIYSGIFNSRTGVNNTNVFSTAEPITKSLDPENGSIQKLYAYDTNLTVFQENKISKALIDKDAIYSAEGVGTPVSSTKVVIGQIVPYKGEYGISTNPESWAQYGFRQYFSDKYRNCILRLSNDGITEISNYGMTDYFRDELNLTKDYQVPKTVTFPVEQIINSLSNKIISFSVNSTENCDCNSIEIGSLLSVGGNTLDSTFVVDYSYDSSSGDYGRCDLTLSASWNPSTYNVSEWPTSVGFLTYKKDKVIGGFDNHNKNYVISIQQESSYNNCGTAPFREHNGMPTTTYKTVNFDESINGWVSFYSYNPTLINSLKNNFYSVDGYKIYKHYSFTPSNNYGRFYDQRYSSSIEFIFNPKPSIVKNFQTISYEGSNGWQVSHFVSDQTGQRYDFFAGGWYASKDITNEVLSLTDGEFTDPVTGYKNYAGFFLKENKYVANLINTSSPNEGEIVFGQAISGIKGYYSTVKLTTDNSTDLGGMKELYCVGSKWVVSSQ